MEIESKIRDFIAKQIMFTDKFELAEDKSLLGEGIIDSMGVMDLVSFVGTEFGLSVNPDEIIPENFDSVANLAEFIRRKRTLA